MELQRLASTTKNFRVDKLFCVFLLEGSSAISEKDFNGPLKESVKGLISTIKDGSLIAIYQFSNEVQMCGNPSTDKNEIRKYIDDIQQMRQQKTNTTEAFEKAKHLFLNNIYSQYKKILFILTDGYPNEKVRLESLAKEIKQLEVTIISIGVGARISFDILSLMSQDDSFCFKISEFGSLNEIMKILQKCPDEEPGIIEFTPAEAVLKSLQSMKLKGKLINNTLKDIPSNTVIKFCKGKYFEQGIKKITSEITAGEEGEFEILLRTRADAKLQDYPSEIIWSLETKSSTIEGVAVLTTGLLRGDFENEFPINVLMFGRKGAGKSATINSLIHCLSLKSQVSFPVVTARKGDHVTTKYSSYPVSSFVDGPGAIDIPFIFWDTWGTSDEDYIKIDIQPFVSGYILQETQRDDINKGKWKLNYDNCKAREIHVVVCIIPLQSSREEETIEDLKKAVDGLINLDLTPIIVVTRIDELIDPESLEREKQNLLNALPLDPRDVYFHRNYINDKNSDKFIDFSSRDILLAILNKAKTQFRKKPPNYFNDIDWSEVHPKFQKKENENPKKKENENPKKKENENPKKKDDKHPKKKNPIEEFLSKLGISKYLNGFIEVGVEEISDINDLDDNDWKKIGVTNIHKKKILNSLKDPFEDIIKLLDELKLTDYVKNLKDAGVCSLSDLKEMDDKDWEEAGVKKLHKNRIKKALNS